MLASPLSDRVSCLVLVFTLIFVVGCGSTVQALVTPQASVAASISVSQRHVRVGKTASFTAISAGHPALGGVWAVMGGKANGTIDKDGTYHAPADLPPSDEVFVSYTYRGATFSESIHLVSAIPSIASVTPRVVADLDTTVVVSGSGFLPGASVVANGHALDTHMVDATHLSAVLHLPSQMDTQISIAVSNPAPSLASSSPMIVNAMFGPKLSFNTPSYFMEQSDDFVGPFPSWVNIKKTFGVAGDGVTDDTVAIQRALDSLDDANPSGVLWLPAGSYNISKTLRITNKRNFSIIGENPATTTIRWVGLPNETMLETDGSTYFRISRVGLDGNNLAAVGEALTSSDYYGAAYYSTFNELSDQHIRGVKIGISLGADAETTVERVFFDHLATVGLAVETFNTLNIFINDSLFVGCGVGVSDAINDGAGSYIVSNSYFSDSQVADMSIGNTGMFTARHNTSLRSKAFFVSSEIYGNSSEVTLQNNVIIDPASSPFQFGNLGPFMLIDNVVRLQNGGTPVITGSSSTEFKKDVFSIGNVYTPNGGAVSLGSGSFQGRLVSYDDIVVPVASIADVQIPPNTYIPPNNSPQIYEVAQLTGAAIQNAINKAQDDGTPSPVVHIPKGVYNVSQPISFKASSSVRLVGDDMSTSALVWTGSGNQPMIRIPTSNVSVKNLQLYGNRNGEGFLLSVADEPNVHVVMDQMQLQGGNGVSVKFDGVEHATAELFSGYTSGSITGVSVTGGLFRAAKEGTLGATNHYTGSLQSEGTGTSFDVSAGGKYMVQDNWHDYGATSARNFILKGSGTVTEQGGAVYMNSDKPFEMDDFEGNVSLLGLAFTGGFQITSATKHSNLFNLGLIGNSGTYLPSSTNNVTVQSVLNSSVGSHIQQTDSPEPQWVRTMLAQTRSEYPIPRPSLANGSSRIRLSRVAVLSSSIGVHLASDALNNGLYYGLSSGSVFVQAGTAGCLPTGTSLMNGKWLLMETGDGDFAIVSKTSGMAIGYAASTDHTLTLEPLSGRYDQRWVFDKVGDGHFRIRNRQSDELMTLPQAGGCVSLGSVGNPNWTVTAY